MGTLKNFRDLEVWQLSRALCKRLWTLRNTSSLERDSGLWNQMNRSSGSVMDNIAEGFERDGNREFIQYLSIAKASCAEVESQIYRAFDRKHINQAEFDELKKDCIAIQSSIAGFIKYLSKSEMKGVKYKKEGKKD